MSLGLTGTAVHTSHDVDPADWEPGTPPAGQPREHVLDYTLGDVTLDGSLDLTRRFGVQLTIPFRTIRQRVQFLDPDGNEIAFTSIHHRDETLTGIGDVSLSGRYSLLAEPRGWIVEARVGVSIPTGHTEPNPFELGRQGLPHEHMFFGTGTLDPLAGIDASCDLGGWRLVGWGSGRGALYQNTQGYRAGAVFAVGLGLQSGLGLRSWSFLIQPEVYFELPSGWAGEKHDPDMMMGSGRLDLIATGGITWAPSSAWQARLLIKVPYYTDAFGQLDIPLIGVLSVSYGADLWGSGR